LKLNKDEFFKYKIYHNYKFTTVFHKRNSEP